MRRGLKLDRGEMFERLLHEETIALTPGDLCLFFTDGISEAMNAQDEEWGEGQLLASARAVLPCPPQALIDRLFVCADAFAAGATQHDDMTVVAVRID